MKKFIVKNNRGVTEHEFPDSISEKEVQRIKEYLALGGKSTKEFTIQARQANKAYEVTNTDITLVANGLGMSEAWVSENLYFIRMIASDTTIDSQWDKFSEGVIRQLGEQYSEGWANGETGGRNMCVMHEREDMVGKTYRYEIIDAKGSDGSVLVDENGAPIRQLIVYAYISKTAMWGNEPVVNYILDGRLCKVSISAWVSGWTYIPSENSNWRPDGEGTDPVGYFFFADDSMVEAIELSLVDLGANGNARITKSKMADPNTTVELVEEPQATTTNTTTKVEDEAENTEANTNTNTENTTDITMEAKMKAIWESLPELLRNKGETITWVAVTLKNHGDGKEFFAPDWCATKFKNIDTALGKSKDKVKELELKVAELESKVSESSDKNITITDENEALTQKNSQNLDKIIELTASLDKLNKELGEVKNEYIEKYVSLTCQVDNKVDAEYISANTQIAKGFTLSELKTKVDELLPILIAKQNSQKLLIERKEKEKKVDW